jgi:hypothetical protein
MDDMISGMVRVQPASPFPPILTHIRTVWCQVAGIVGKVVEFPFDTVKVLLQTESTQHLYKSPLQCA